MRAGHRQLVWEKSSEQGRAQGDGYTEASWREGPRIKGNQLCSFSAHYQEESTEPQLVLKPFQTQRAESRDQMSVPRVMIHHNSALCGLPSTEKAQVLEAIKNEHLKNITPQA